MKVPRDLAVLDAARLVAKDVNRLLAGLPRILHSEQLRDAAQSIGANIAEGFGRGPGADRARFVRMARGSAEECIQHLRANSDAGLLVDSRRWPIHNRLVTVIRMIDSLLRSPRL